MVTLARFPRGKAGWVSRIAKVLSRTSRSSLSLSFSGARNELLEGFTAPGNSSRSAIDHQALQRGANRSDSDFLAVQYLEELACRMMKTAGSAIDTMKKMHHVRRYIDPILIDMAQPDRKGAMRWSESVHNLLSCPPLQQAAQPTFIADDFRSNLRSARHLRKENGRQVETAETHNRKGTCPPAGALFQVRRLRPDGPLRSAIAAHPLSRPCVWDQQKRKKCERSW